MENDHPIQFWLKAIYDAISNLVEKVGTSNQADWEEEETTSAAYVKNKPTIPAVTVVPGAVADDEFTPTSATFSDVLAAIATSHGIVYLSYTVSEETVYDMVVTAGSSLIKTAAGVEWEAPSE